MQSSDSVENYIKGIYALSHEKEWVNTKDLAKRMNTKPSSVTDMVQKLDTKKLVKYQKYKGVQLTAEGQSLALRVIRKHRLWEVFLEKKLGFSWDEVHDIAEQLEHVSSPELVKRLDAFLGHPKYDPHGDPIPDEKGTIKIGKRKLISDCDVGDYGKIVGVNDSSSSFLQFLELKKIHLGVDVEVVNKHEFDQSMEIALDNGKQKLSVSLNVAENLFIEKR